MEVPDLVVAVSSEGHFVQQVIESDAVVRLLCQQSVARWSKIAILLIDVPSNSAVREALLARLRSLDLVDLSVVTTASEAVATLAGALVRMRPRRVVVSLADQQKAPIVLSQSPRFLEQFVVSRATLRPAETLPRGRFGGPLIALCLKEQVDDVQSGNEKLVARHTAIYSDLNSYIAAFSTLATSGCRGIRMGKFPDRKNQLCETSAIIDYRNSKDRTDANDIEVMSAVDIALVQSSGLWALARGLRRPILWIDCNISSRNHCEEGDLVVPLTLWSIAEKRLLRFEEQRNLKHGYFRSHLLELMQLEIIPPPAELLTGAIRELLNQCESQNPSRAHRRNYERSNRQTKHSQGLSYDSLLASVYRDMFPEAC